MQKVIIVLTSVTGLLVGCTPSPEVACTGYCQSELECGQIDRASVEACIQACHSRLDGTASDCGLAFRRYAACYDASTRCSADDCYRDFEGFAKACAWYTDEVALSSSRSELPSGS